MGGTIASGGGSTPTLPLVEMSMKGAYGTAADAAGGPLPTGNVQMQNVQMPATAPVTAPVAGGGAQAAPQPQLNVDMPQPQADVQAALTELVRVLNQLVAVLQAQVGANGVQGGGGASGCGTSGCSHGARSGGGANAAPDAVEDTSTSEKKKANGGGGGGGGGGSAPTATAPTSPTRTGGTAQRKEGETSYNGLQPKSLAVLNAAHQHGLKLISGLRAGERQGHGNGSAIDVSNVKGGSRGGSKEMEAYAEAMRAAGKAGDPNIGYVIYRQRIASARDNWAWRPMEDRGSNTANHYDHVHVSTDPKR